MRVRFSASDAWIDQVVDACQGEVAGVPAASGSIRAATVVAAVCRHDAFSNDAAFQSAVRAAMEGGAEKARASHLRSAARFLSKSRSIRTDDVRINTRDPFTRDYLAPAASRVRPAIDRLFEVAYRLPDGVAAAVARYFVLLTIHPFPDGNGRSCRAQFAATVARWVDGPLLVLTLPWLHQDRNRQFHLLAKMARLGDFRPMLDFHARGVEAGRSRFGALVEALLDAIGQDDEPEVQAAMAEIRSRARELIGV